MPHARDGGLDRALILGDLQRVEEAVFAAVAIAGVAAALILRARRRRAARAARHGPP